MKTKLLCLFLIISSLFSMSACRARGKEDVAPKDLVWAIGAPLPDAKDFFDRLPEGYSVGFAEESPFAHLAAGENTVKLFYKTEKGRKKTAEFLAVFLSKI